MRLALRTILCAGLLALLLAPLASASGWGWDLAEMYAYKSLTRNGNIVFAYAYSDLAYPDDPCPASWPDYDCWHNYWSSASFSVFKDGQWQDGKADSTVNGEIEVSTSVDVDAGEWTLETEHDVDVEWQDWCCNASSYYDPYTPLHDDLYDSLTIDPEISISDSEALWDGDIGYFDVTAEVGTPTWYEWTFEHASPAGNNPNVQFSDPYEASTLTDAHWYAYPNGACTANSSATYWITATVGFQSGAVSDWTYLWVDVPWTKGGETTAPTVVGTYTRQLVNGVWKVIGTNLTRTSPSIVIYVPASSQFRYKLEVHEQKHGLQFAPGGMLDDLWIPADLHNLLIVLTASTEAALVALVNGTTTTYLNGEAATLASRLSAAEAEAYGLSDQISPQYLYQNCGRF